MLSGGLSIAPETGLNLFFDQVEKSSHLHLGRRLEDSLATSKDGWHKASGPIIGVAKGEPI